jgi:FixJ family two-component response regulator
VRSIRTTKLPESCRIRLSSTGHGDIPMLVLAMKACAIEFLTKSFRDQALFDAIHRTIQLGFASGKLQPESPEQANCR